MLEDGKVLDNDDKLIELNEQFYIQVEDKYFVKAEKNEFTNQSSLERLRPETREVVLEVFEKAESGEIELKNGVVEVYSPQVDSESLSQVMPLAAHPVVNEQVCYVAVGNEKVIRSGDNAFEDYASRTLRNVAITIAQSALSEISPISGTIATIASLFPSRYNEVRSYTDWTYGVKLSEEKVVQLSWVYVEGTAYLGAQTQRSTIKYTTIITSGLSPTVTDESGFLNYKTANYQSPENIARNNYNNTWIERITGYKIDGVTIDTLVE